MPPREQSVEDLQRDGGLVRLEYRITHNRESPQV